MEIITFKKIVNETLTARDFLKRSSYYYRTSEDLICIIGLQKSNYSNGYYINISYVIRALNTELTNPREVDGDIQTRFLLHPEKESTDLFDLDQLAETDHEVVRKSLNENINQYSDAVTSLRELKELINRIPSLLYQTKLVAKKYLGYA